MRCPPTYHPETVHHCAMLLPAMVFLVRDPVAIIVQPVKPFGSVSLSDWWEVTHTLLQPLYASILLLFKCQFKSVSFSLQNLFDRIGSVCSKPTRTHTHTDKAHHSQCNYHAVWLYTAFKNPCVSCSACINPAVRNHCMGSFQLYTGILFTQSECITWIKKANRKYWSELVIFGFLFVDVMVVSEMPENIMWW